ncbi:MAG: NAD-dependent epimerase/dehydratase family protein [Deltaproteobacteria bacterium]|nr:NAD-dependent epimerase/dehydratase family protein [Deltaproteobacteria bacterium]MBP6833513.1 NAD-dependent epimerase/dehydratase family protein [Deltaproteobacteria bacterium]
MIEGRRILLTGGAGFIGTALVRRLCETNHCVVFDLLRRNALGPAGLDKHPNVTLIPGDVRDAAALGKAMDGCTHVVHLASIAGVDTVLQNPVPTMEIALEGTMAALRCARDRMPLIERFVDFSTSEVFGKYAFRVAEGDVTTLGAVGEARWTYAVSKLATEHLAHCYHKQFGLPTVSIRPFNIFGPGQVGGGAIHAFVLRAIKNEPIHIHNQGDQIRSWCYIDDIVDGILLTLERDSAVGQAFNIGNTRATVTIYQLARMVVSLAKSSSEIKFIDWPFADVELRIPDVTKAKELLGFQARVELEDGIERTIAWYREKLAREAQVGA